MATLDITDWTVFKQLTVRSRYCDAKAKVNNKTQHSSHLLSLQCLQYDLDVLFTGRYEMLSV